MPAQRGKDLLLKIDRGTTTPALTVGGPARDGDPVRRADGGCHEPGQSWALA